MYSMSATYPSWVVSVQCFCEPGARYTHSLQYLQVCAADQMDRPAQPMMYLREDDYRLNGSQESGGRECHVVATEWRADLDTDVEPDDERKENDQETKRVADDNPSAVVVCIH